ncbi:MAG: hypothetical protein PHR07_03900 [Acidaminococcaceae bacterium]|nr:hypothetical protein [Acidaminococcaceae bacterium]
MAAVMVLDVGLALYNTALKAYVTEPKYVHWGTGTTDPVAGNTTLETPRGEDRTAGTSSVATTISTGDTYQVVGTIVCADTGFNCTEAALFTASSAGTMLLRGTFAAVALAVGDSIEFTIKSVLNQGS